MKKQSTTKEVKVEEESGRYAELAKKAQAKIQQELRLFDEYLVLGGIAQETIGRVELDLGTEFLEILSGYESKIIDREYITIETMVERGARESESCHGKYLERGMIICFLEGTGRPLVPKDLEKSVHTARSSLAKIKPPGSMTIDALAQEPVLVKEFSYAIQELIGDFRAYLTDGEKDTETKPL